MTVYTADPIPMKSVSAAQAFETADTINRPHFVNRPVVLNFDYSPSSTESVTIGLDTVSVTTAAINVAITFTASVSLPIHRSVINYEWKFGDGEVVQTGANTATHTYTVLNEVGVRVSLVITDDLGNTYSCGHQVYLVS